MFLLVQPGHETHWHAATAYVRSQGCKQMPQTHPSQAGTAAATPTALLTYQNRKQQHQQRKGQRLLLL